MSETATPSKEREARKDLDRAVIRFAATPGRDAADGRAIHDRIGLGRQRPRHAPNFRPRFAAPAARCSASPASSSSRQPACLHAGDRLDCLVADESRRTQGPPQRPEAGRSAHREHRGLREAQLDKAATPRIPRRSALAERYRLHKVDMSGLTHPGHRPIQARYEEKDRTKNFFALGLVS